jgi:hypothetical protein
MNLGNPKKGLDFTDSFGKTFIFRCRIYIYAIMEFKISPLILFIILLVVLALSAMIKSYMGVEGFITYNHASAPFSTKTVEIYSTDNPVTKIYDDIYYDPRNGNIVVVYTKDAYTNAASVDAEGKTIKSIEIVSRKNDATNKIVKYENATIDKTDSAGVSKAEVIKQVTPESRKATIDAVDVAWSYKSGTSQVNYFTWGTNTYIYVMDITGISTSGNSSAGGYDTARFGNSYSGNGVAYSGAIKHASATYYTGSINPGITIDFTGADGDVFDDIIVESGYPQQTSSGYEDKSTIEPHYHPSRQIYNITSNIKYDIANGNLVIIKTTSTTKEANVYYRSGADKREDDYTPDIALTTVADAQSNNAAYITQSFNKSVSNPFFVQDTTNKNTIMYWPSGENTLIAVFENRNANGYVPIKKVVRFTSSGVWAPPKEEEKKEEKKTDNSGNTDISGGNYGDFWKWWSYFNSNAVGGLSNDYMLKTQIVPPVCPSCPACQGGACTNCGGAGGSGSMAADGSSLAIKGPSSAAASLGQSAGETVQGTAAVAGLTAIGGGAIAANLAGKTLDTAGNIVNKTVDTAGNIVNKTFDTAGNIVNKTFDTAGNVVNTTGGLLQSAGSGLTNLFTSDPRRVGYEQSYSGPRPGSNNTGIYNPLPKQQGQTSGQTIDPYTYNGALQSKGSNFRPVTTDFSSFGL